MYKASGRLIFHRYQAESFSQPSPAEYVTSAVMFVFVKIGLAASCKRDCGDSNKLVENSTSSVQASGYSEALLKKQIEG